VTAANAESRRTEKKEWLFVSSIFIISMVLKLAFIDSNALVFDEATHIMIAKYFAVHGFSWQMERFFGSTFPPIQYFIMGWAWLLSGWLHIGVSEETTFRSVSVVMSCLTIPFIFAIARRLGRSVAVVASLSYAFLPYVVAYSRLAIIDLPAVFWLTVGIYCYMRSLDGKDEKPLLSRWLWLAGVFFGAAAFTKVYLGFVLVAVVCHRALVTKVRGGKGWKSGLASVGAYSFPVFASTAAVVLIVSLLAARNPLLLYLMFRDTVNSQFFGNWITRPLVPVTLFTHLGLAVSAVSVLGLVLLFYRQGKIDRVNSFFGILVLVYTVVFLPFHFARYLLVMVPALCVALGFGLVWICRMLRPARLRTALERPRLAIRPLLATGLIILIMLDFLPLLKVYSAKVIDDYWVCDSFREVGKYIQQQAEPGEWVLTNGHFNVVRYYSGIDSEYVDAELYMGASATGSMNVYWIYHDGIPAVTAELTADEESRLGFFVLVSNYSVIPQNLVLFSEDLAFSWIKPDDFLNSYLSTYFQPVPMLKEDDGVTVQVYDRSSRNLFSPMADPSVYVGEPGAVSTSEFINWNGFILGNGWSDPYCVTENGTTYWVRNATRDDRKSLFSSSILYVRSPDEDSVLRVTYLDRGSGSRTIATAYNTTLINGKQELLTKSIGHIDLTDSGIVKMAEFKVPHDEYYDVWNTTQGFQQLFGFFTDGNPLPIIKLELAPQ
jgi:hypothetical protein